MFKVVDLRGKTTDIETKLEIIDTIVKIYDKDAFNNFKFYQAEYDNNCRKLIIKNIIGMPKKV